MKVDWHFDDRNVILQKQQPGDCVPRIGDRVTAFVTRRVYRVYEVAWVLSVGNESTVLEVACSQYDENGEFLNGEDEVSDEG